MAVGAIPIPRAPNQGGGGNFKPLEPGIYLVEVEAVDKKENDFGTQVSVTFRVISDMRTGNSGRGKLWENLPVPSGADDEQSLKMVWKWERLVKAFGQTQEALDKATKDGHISYNPD